MTQQYAVNVPVQVPVTVMTTQQKQVTDNVTQQYPVSVPVQVPVTVMTTQARQVPRQVAVTRRVMVPVQVPAAVSPAVSPGAVVSGVRAQVVAAVLSEKPSNPQVDDFMREVIDHP